MPAFSNKLGLTRGGLRLWVPSDVTTATPAPYQWYDASSSTTVTMSSTTVTAWADRSGGARNLTGTGSITRTTGGLNGLDIINMNNTSANQLLAGTVSITGNTMTTFTVHKNTVGSGRLLYARVLSFRYNVSPFTNQDFNNLQSICGQLYGTGAAGQIGVFYNSSNRVNTTASTNGSAWNLVMSYRNGDQVGISNNGNAIATATGLGTTNFQINQFRTGNDFATADSGMNGSIAEILIYTTSLNQDSIDRVTGYLAWKWGLQGNLPAAHPYKNSAPYNETPPDYTINIASTGSNNVFLLDANSDSTFTDVGGNALAIAKFGTVNYSTSIPFGSSTLNSANFGTGSGYLKPAVNSVFAFGTGNWTFECFINLTARPTSSGLTPLFDTEANANGGRPDSIIIYLTATGICHVYQNGAAQATSGASVVALNTWTHVAVARNGSTTTIYFNGTSVGSTTYTWSSMAGNNGNLGVVNNVGSATSQYGISGLMSNARVTKGTAVYTANFTTPTSDLSAG